MAKKMWYPKLNTKGTDCLLLLVVVALSSWAMLAGWSCAKKEDAFANPWNVCQKQKEPKGIMCVEIDAALKSEGASKDVLNSVKACRVLALISLLSVLLLLVMKMVLVKLPNKLDTLLLLLGGVSGVVASVLWYMKVHKHIKDKDPTDDEKVCPTLVVYGLAHLIVLGLVVKDMLL